MMQLQTPALRLLVLICSLVPSDSFDSDRAACRRLFLGVSSMPLHLASRLSVSDPPGAGGGAASPWQQQGSKGAGCLAFMSMQGTWDRFSFNGLLQTKTVRRHSGRRPTNALLQTLMLSRAASSGTAE